MTTLYVNKGDAKYPRNNFMYPEYLAYPGLLQSMIARVSAEITKHTEDRLAFKVRLNEPDIGLDEAAEIMTLLKLSKQTLGILHEIQTHQKYKQRLLKQMKRAERTAT